MPFFRRAPNPQAPLRHLPSLPMHKKVDCLQPTTLYLNHKLDSSWITDDGLRRDKSPKNISDMCLDPWDTLVLTTSKTFSFWIVICLICSTQNFIIGPAMVCSKQARSNWDQNSRDYFQFVDKCSYKWCCCRTSGLFHGWDIEAGLFFILSLYFGLWH